MDNQTLPTPPTPDEEWAKKLGLDFDPEKASQTPPTPEPPKFDGRNWPQQPFQNPGNGQQTSWNANPYQQPEQMPPTYMVWSVVALILCCFPAAVVAIIYSAQVSSKFYAKDYEGARRASERAEIWIIASIVLGVISMAFYLPFTLLK